MNELKKVLVVDDEDKILDVLKIYLEKAGYIVYVCTNGHEAIDVFEKNAPDILILDLMLPDMSGEQICRYIRQKSNVPIIMLTAKVSSDSVVNGLNIGADDYIKKPFVAKELVAKVEAILRRTNVSKDELGYQSFNNGDLRISLKNIDVKKNGKSLNLTSKEFELLSLFIKYKNKVFTREEIIKYLYNYNFEGYDRTIDAHIKNLRHKIEDDTKKPKYILTIHSIGYKFGGSLDEDKT